MKYTEHEIQQEDQNQSNLIQSIFGFIVFAPFRLVNEITSKLLFLGIAMVRKVLMTCTFVSAGMLILDFLLFFLTRRMSTFIPLSVEIATFLLSFAGTFLSFGVQDIEYDVQDSGESVEDIVVPLESSVAPIQVNDIKSSHESPIGEHVDSVVQADDALNLELDEVSEQVNESSMSNLDPLSASNIDSLMESLFAGTESLDPVGKVADLANSTLSPSEYMVAEPLRQAKRASAKRTPPDVPPEPPEIIDLKFDIFGHRGLLPENLDVLKNLNMNLEGF